MTKPSLGRLKYTAELKLELSVTVSLCNEIVPYCLFYFIRGFCCLLIEITQEIRVCGYLTIFGNLFFISGLTILHPKIHSNDSIYKWVCALYLVDTWVFSRMFLLPLLFMPRMCLINRNLLLLTGRFEELYLGIT